MAWHSLFRSNPAETGSFPLRLPRLAVEILVALSLAFLVWLYIRTRDHDSLDNMSVPVLISLAPGFADQYDLEVTGPTHVVVSFTGPPSGIRELRGMLQRGEVRVNIPLSVSDDRRFEGRYRETVRVQAGDVPAPAGVTPLVAEGRNLIQVIVHRLVDRELPVRLNHPQEEGIGQVEVEPATVMVRGPEDILERVHSIPTRPYHLPTSSSGALVQAKVLNVHLPLVREMEGRPIRVQPGAVTVRISLQPRRRTYQVKNISVKFLCPTSFSYRPQFRADQASTISIRIKAASALRPPAVGAFIDLTDGDFKTGLNVKPLRLQLPKGCQLAQDPPGPLEFEVVPTETAAGWLGVVTEP